MIASQSRSSARAATLKGMAYDEKAAERVREALEGRKGVGELKMFGGICFTLNGNMCIGVVNDDLVVRFAPEHDEAVMAKPHVRPMDFTHRPMKGFAFVAAPGYKTSKQLDAWIDRCWSYVAAMPPKKAKKARPVKKR
jgi:TfoX/Sxy family transcriptional regulator of competence genes